VTTGLELKKVASIEALIIAGTAEWMGIGFPVPILGQLTSAL
jgi:hypothetical protein